MDIKVVISILGIVFALGLMIILIMKGVNIFVVAISCSAIVAVTGGLNLYDALKGNYMAGFVKFFQNYFLIFLTGTIMGKVMEVTNGAKAIAKMIINRFGTKMALISIPLACGIISYGGVSVFVAAFAVFPIALEVFRESDYPRRFIPASLTFGCATFAMVAPGAPQIQNAIPATGLGTDLMAGAIVGFISSGTILVIGCIALMKMINKAKQNGEIFVANPTDVFKEDDVYPNGMLALLPLIITILLINIKVGGKPLVPLEAGVLFGAILVIVLLNKHQDNSRITHHLGEACITSVSAIANTCAVVGFGAVVQATLAFPVVVNAMVNMPGPYYASAAVGTTVIAGMCGSASGGLGVAVPILGPIFLARGVSAAALHRIMSISSSALDSLPHNGYIVTVTNGLCNETHKNAYKPVFWLTVVIPTIGTIISVILFSLFPNLP